ncbi:uncharacterized protein LOC118411879 [Branchiostoma floridae]|uniref:Uncharacterized protein LOC118411879 n=1 Tax=Branchiostoma floridae TaxID=7739 RepID=A0A9J7KTY9_BRAFL|nr:uncharacterized protein LOC118411879 [Branchiostoma floridae]
MINAAGAKVHATVLEATEQDERDAKVGGVNLIKPVSAGSTAKPSVEWLTLYHSVHFPDIPSDVCCIVGHVDVTSRAARKIKEERFPHAKLVMFGHVAPEETEHYKSDEKALGVGRKEASIQDDIGKADVVFSVGPRIHRHYDRFLRRNHVTHHIFLPEPSKVFREADMIFEEDKVRKPERVVLSIGRVRNVERLKGHDLAAGSIDKAAHRLDNQYTLRLRVRGIDKNDFTKTKRILEEKLRSGRVKPTLLPYGTQEEIRRDMEACHLVLMPSRAEPFGLVGLEAIAAGVPVLISEHSGLAELIEELSDRLGQPTFRHCIVRMKGDTATDADTEKWAERIEDVLKNARSEFEEARAFREKLLASKYWEESHQTFLQACGITGRFPRAAMPPSKPAERPSEPDREHLAETVEEAGPVSRLEQLSLEHPATAAMSSSKQADTPRCPQTDDKEPSAETVEETTGMAVESSALKEKRPLLSQSERARAMRTSPRLLQQEEIELEELGTVTETTHLSPAGEEQEETGEAETAGMVCCRRCPHGACSVL